MVMGIFQRRCEIQIVPRQGAAGGSGDSRSAAERAGAIKHTPSSPLGSSGQRNGHATIRIRLIAMACSRSEQVEDLLNHVLERLAQVLMISEEPSPVLWENPTADRSIR